MSFTFNPLSSKFLFIVWLIETSLKLPPPEIQFWLASAVKLEVNALKLWCVSYTVLHQILDLKVVSRTNINSSQREIYVLFNEADFFFVVAVVSF